MAVEAAAQKYWAMSTHLRRGLQSQGDKEAFLTFTVAPTAKHTRDQDEARLLRRLLNEAA